MDAGLILKLLHLRVSRPFPVDPHSSSTLRNETAVRRILVDRRGTRASKRRVNVSGYSDGLTRRHCRPHVNRNSSFNPQERGHDLSIREG